MKSPKLLFLVTEDWYFCSHRLPLARAARDNGFEVVVATRVRDHGDDILAAGLGLIPISLARNSKNPLSELSAIGELVRIYRKERPDIVHHVAMKPVLYGSVAARLVGVPGIVNALAGMGYLFISSDKTARLMRPLVTSAFRVLLGHRGARLILQNPDDVGMFTESGLAPRESIDLIRGSGVDLSNFSPVPEPQGLPTIVLAARMLWDKGVGEFVEAATLLRSRGIAARFVLVGDGDPGNPAAIPTSTLEAWHDSGVVEWWGRRDDMPVVFAQTHIVCLPSYREGLPKVLLEAAASGRAIVTTDAPGCREVVRHGDNGFLVPVRNATALADAVQQLIENPDLRQKMGRKGRERAMTEFSIEKVINDTLEVYRKLLS